MAERGAPPKVPRVQRRLLRFISAFTSPLLPDDYLELINPLWSTRELRGKVVDVKEETPDAATVVIQPGYEWEGHEPGQYLRIGVDLNGRRHWRAYSLTSDPKREDGCISITVKNVDEGVVSPYLVRKGPHGAIVGLGGVEGDFLLPDPVPEKILFISAGSGITPIMSMLRSMDHEGDMPDTVHLHSAGTAEEVIFGDEMRGLAEKHEKFRLHEQHTATDAGRMGPRTWTSCARTGRSGRPTSPAHRTCWRRSRSTGRSTATASSCTWSGSSRSWAARTSRRARAAPSSSSRATARPRATAPSPSSWPARRPGSSWRTDAERASATRAWGL